VLRAARDFGRCNDGTAEGIGERGHAQEPISAMGDDQKQIPYPTRRQCMAVLADI
jgi:hypothetical protein